MTTTRVSSYKSRRTKSASKGGVFRVVEGSHLGDCPEGCRCDNGPRNHLFDSYTCYSRITARAGELPLAPADYTGDVVESAADLVALHGAKFVRLRPDEAERLLKLRAEQIAEGQPLSAPAAPPPDAPPKGPGAKRTK